MLRGVGRLSFLLVFELLLMVLSPPSATALGSSDTLKVGWPIAGGKGTVWIGFGLQPNHPVHNVQFMSPGLYLECAEGTEVVSVADGVVIAIIDSTYDDLGQQVVVRHSNGVCSYYANIRPIEGLEISQRVRRGKVLGSVRKNALYGKSFLLIEFTVSRDPNNVGVIWKGKVDDKLEKSNSANVYHDPGFFLDLPQRGVKSVVVTDLYRGEL